MIYKASPLLVSFTKWCAQVVCLEALVYKVWQREMASSQFLSFDFTSRIHYGLLLSLSCAVVLMVDFSIVIVITS